MKELMLHVERIVRPVSATQSRKLRMRQELLSHLQAALEEERCRFSDEAAALEGAKQRLGDTEEITRQLQQSVPVLERILNLRIELSFTVEEIEHQIARIVYGMHNAMTLAHASVLLAMSCLLAGVPCCASPLVRGVFTGSSGTPSHFRLFFSGFIFGLSAILLVSIRHVFALASASGSFDLPGAIRRGVIIFGLQIALMTFLAYAATDRPATIVELSACAALAISLLVASALLTRWIVVLRRRYDEWLSLDLEGTCS